MLLKKVMLRRGKGPPPEGNVDLSALHDRKRKTRKHLKLAVLACAATCFVIGSLWLIFRSPMLKLRDFRIEGNSIVEDSEIKGLLWARIFRDSRLRYLLGFYNLLIWPSSLGPDDLRFLPEIKKVMIQKSYFDHRVTVRVEERELFGIWCFAKVVERSECGWFDREGVIVSHAPAAEGSLIVKVADFAQDPLPVRSKILPPQFIGNFFSILDALAAADMHVARISLENLEMQEIRVRTADGPEILFSLRFPAANTASVMKNLRLDSRQSFSSLEYIDLRVENRAYYK